MIQPINESKNEKEETLSEMLDVMYEALHSGSTNLIEKLGVLECLKIQLLEKYMVEDETGDSK